MRPLFSIITVTYNAAPAIEATMKSVASQTCHLYEHLVIDGASKDDTVEIARRWATERTKIVSEPDQGIYDAMNKGIEKAEGDYVIFLNAGDTFHAADTLQTIADVALDNGYPGIIYGQTEIVDANRRKLGARHLSAPPVLTVESFSDGMVVCHQAFIVLRKLVDSYDLRYRYSADYEWCIRCLQRSHRNFFIDRVLIDYLSEGVTTAHFRASLLERFRIMSHYYGFFPTLFRHIRFLMRYLRRGGKGVLS